MTSVLGLDIGTTSTVGILLRLPNEVLGLAFDGGPDSRVWMQIGADVLQHPLRHLTGHPGSRPGAAWTATVGTGLTSDWSAIAPFVGLEDRHDPNPDNAMVYTEGYRAFRDLYRRTAPRATGHD